MQNDYTESLEILNLAKQLQEKYSAFIGYVDLDLVAFALVDGYKPKNAKVSQMSGITQAWVRDILFNKFNTKGKLYCLSVWSELWDELEQSKKEWVVFKSLYSISPDLDGKIRATDVQDYGFIIEYFIRSGFGPYWESKDSLPSLLSQDLPLILPLDE